MQKNHQQKDAAQRGVIERIPYTTVNEKGKPVSKYANIYLPYGYDAEKPYNIFYLMHGGGGNPDAWLDSSLIKNMLDTAMAAGEIEPMLIVFPTYYTEGTGKPGMENEHEKTVVFQKELTADLIPAVEGKYHTYAKTTDAKGLKSSRMHRGFGGFSMGSVTTWNAFLYNLDVFAYFLPISGDSWVIEQMGGRTKPAETAKALHDAAAASGYGSDEYFIFAITGTKDIAFPQLEGQVKAMLAYPDTFADASGFGAGNFLWHFQEEAVHSYMDVYQYVYHALPYFFKK